MKKFFTMSVLFLFLIAVSALAQDHLYLTGKVLKIKGNKAVIKVLTECPGIYTFKLINRKVPPLNSIIKFSINRSICPQNQEKTLFAILKWKKIKRFRNSGR